MQLIYPVKASRQERGTNSIKWQVNGMKFGIVGPISKDRMVLSDGSIVNKLGAVAYSALALAKLLEGTNDCVVCLSHLSPDDSTEVRAFLEHPKIIMPATDSADTN